MRSLHIDGDFMDQSLLPNIYDFISHTYPFSLLNTLEQDALAAATKISYYSTEDVLQDEALTSVGLFMIRTGAVEQINKDGTLRARLGVGDSFGFTQLNKTGKSDYTVHFLENSLIYIISKQILEFIIAKNHHVSEYFDSKDWVRLSTVNHLSDERRAAINSHFLQPVSTCCIEDIATVSPQETIQTTAQIIGKKHAECAFVIDETGKINGIITKSDLALRVVATGHDIKDRVDSIMTKNPVCINATEPLNDALKLMIDHNIKALPVISADKVIGVITTSQLLQNSQLQAVFLLKSIKRQEKIEELSKLSLQKQEVFKTLVENDVTPKTIQLIMSRIADAFNKRLIELYINEHGAAPCNFAWIAAGSLARCEVQLLSDQDNALILERECSDKELEYFKDLASFVCNNLDKCGYPLCDGNFMASNEKWCQSYKKWCENYDNWILSPNHNDLLNISVFMDIRFIYGDEFLVNKLKNHVLTRTKDNSRFLAMMIATSLAVNPPLGLFKKFVLTKDGQNRPYLNIKKQAINLIVELARIYALSTGSFATETSDRINDDVKSKKLSEDDGRELSEALCFLNILRFKHQITALEHKEDLTNNLVPDTLSQFERNHLKDAFRIIAKQQEAAKFRFCGGM